MNLIEMQLEANQRYLTDEVLRNERNRLNAQLVELSIDDYNQTGHNIETDIRDIENMMENLDIRF